MPNEDASRVDAPRVDASPVGAFVQMDAAGQRRMARRGLWMVAAVLLLLAIGAGRAMFSRDANAKALASGTEERAKVYVQTALAKPVDVGQTISLPGTLQGFVQTPINARASGYLKRWYKDIGSRVDKGELLAEIETPEIDQQLSQAIAARAQAAASLELARSSAERWASLRKKDAVSQQELDERESASKQARSNLAAADANVARLQQLESFKRVLAPFAGVITRRNVDVGDLIDAGAGSTPGRAMFQLAQTDPLRIYVSVPQSYAQLVKVGQEVQIEQDELRGQKFSGQVTRTASAIDTTTRTMQVEVLLPNKDDQLLPGAFVHVAMQLQPSRTLVVPATTLIFRKEGSRIAVVDGSGRVHLRTVRLGRNYGETVEVLAGLADADRVVLNPPDSLADGDRVEVPAPAGPRTRNAAAG